jgi:hypothetical protein
VHDAIQQQIFRCDFESDSSDRNPFDDGIALGIRVAKFR